jgi:spermidine synthase
VIETPLKTRLLVYSLFRISGVTALVYQVTWVRNLSLIFGASFQAISVVLASFMAGLAVGSFFFGRRSWRIRRPLRL